MKAFLEIVRLELRRLLRSKALAALTVASLAWMFAFPHLVKSDGTVDGAHELYVHFSLGGVFVMCLVALAASAAGSLSREREQKRLQLTAVRPVRIFAVALARSAALTLAGAFVLALSAAVLAFNVDVSRPCDKVLSPVMESPRAEAEKMYDYYMASPETPDDVKKAKRSVVIRLLTQRAFDNYMSIPAGQTASWNFDAPEEGEFAVRLRFTNDFETRQDVMGEFRIGDHVGAMTNKTQAVVRVPLAKADGGTKAGERNVLNFRNDGDAGLMLRPRRDINLLVKADSFGWNILRAYLELVAILSLTTSFGVFLGAGLGRSVAVFTMVSVIFVSVASSDILDLYPDQLEKDRADSIGLVITRTVEQMTRPAVSLRPLAALAADERVEPREVASALAMDLIVFPLVLSLLSAFALVRKQE